MSKPNTAFQAMSEFKKKDVLAMLLEVAIDEKQLKFTTGYDVLSSSKVFLISSLRANEANCAADIKTVKDIIVRHFGPIEIEVTAFKMEEASDY